MQSSNTENIIVKVLSESNMEGMILQTPNSLGRYANIEFVFDDRIECDYVVVINQVLEKTVVYCDPQNVWALMMEPSIDGFFDFTRYGHNQYGKVFTTNKQNADSKYVQSHIMTPWHTGRSYDTLLNHELGKKEKMMSCVSSNKSFLPGHKKRIDFVNKLKEADLGIDFYGRGTNPIEDKWQALYPYKFSLAIENSSSPDYWTEKLSDCFMAYTIPIYYGCTNIDNYFPPGSVLKIDINNPAYSIKVIKEAVQNNYYEKNFDALIEARNRYLSEYHFFPCLVNHILKDIQSSNNKSGQKQAVCIQPMKRSLFHRFKSFYQRLNSNLQKTEIN